MHQIQTYIVLWYFIVNVKYWISKLNKKIKITLSNLLNSNNNLIDKLKVAFKLSLKTTVNQQL